MTRIFLNYRRSDEPGFVQALHQKLQLAFPGEVYMDVDGANEPGDDILEVIQNRVAESDVLLAVIGPRWLSELNARKNANSDYVVAEIQLALEHRKRVVPVMLHGAEMPRPEALPPSIRKLALRHALFLRAERFGADCDDLIQALRRQQQRAAAIAQAAKLTRPHRARSVGLHWLQRRPASPPRRADRKIPASATIGLLAAGALLAAGLLLAIAALSATVELALVFKQHVFRGLDK